MTEFPKTTAIWKYGKSWTIDLLKDIINFGEKNSFGPLNIKEKSYFFKEANCKFSPKDQKKNIWL